MWSFLKRKIKETLNRWRDYPLREDSVYMERYRVIRCLGMGSYGQAYACTELDTGVAVLLKRSMPSKKELGKRLLKRESDILQKLDHPQIPKWHGYVRQGREEALVMKLIEGVSVEHKAMADGHAYTLAEALRIVRQLLEPLAHVHQAGFVHRDVRIPNVLEHNGRVSLIDFGLACGIGERLPEELLIGLKEKPLSASRPQVVPEDSGSELKRRMRLPEPSSDLYGLGHLLLFMLYAGYEPAAGQEERSWEEELALPREAAGFIRRLLQQEEPGWPSAAECGNELDRLLDGGQIAKSGEQKQMDRVKASPNKTRDPDAVELP